MRPLTRLLTLVLLCVLPLQALAAGTMVYQGGNAATILTPSGSGTHTQQTGGANLRFNPAGGVVSVLGDLTVSQLATPATATVTPQGTTGATTYGYKVVARTGTGTTAASTEGTTTTGNATLSTTNFNRVTWAAVDGASGYDVYRTTGGADQGKINSAIVATTVLDDTGLTGSGTAPTTNTTGTFTTSIGGGAPTDAGYWVDTANGTLSAERSLGALTTGLVLNTVTTGVGVPSTYAGTLCTNQFPRSLNASAVATCASVSLTADVTGILPTANGGTGIAYFTAAGPTAARVYTFPDAAATVLTTNAAVTIAQGGTGQTTAQAAINALSTVAGATNEHVLTKDTATGNAIFKAAAGGITVLDRDVTEVEVVNTVTETTVYSYSVAGGTLGTSGMLRLTILGDHLNNSGGTVNLSIRVKFGGTTIGGTTWGIGTGANRRGVRIGVEIVAANSTAAQRTSTIQMISDANGVAGDISGGNFQGPSAHNSLALDSTAAQTLSVTVEHASAAATISTIARTAILESL